MTATLRETMLVLCVAAATAWGQAPSPIAAVDPAPQVQPDLRQATEAAMAEAIGKGEFDRALTILQGARTRGLPLGLYHLLAAKLCAAQRDEAGEEGNLKGAIYRDPQLVEAYLRLAAITERRGLWLVAADFYSQALQVDPRLPEAYLELARLLREHDRHKTAIETLERGKRALPDSAAILMALGRLHRELGHRAAAVTEYQAAARLTTGAQRLECLLQVGDLRLEDGDLAAAFASYQTAIAEGLEPTEPEYGRIAVATDALAWEALQQAWAAMEAYLAGKPDALEREDVHASLSRALSREREFVAAMDKLRLPSRVAGQHSQRKFHYSLLCEALTNGLSYLDTGDLQMVEAGRARRQDAETMRKALAGAS